MVGAVVVSRVVEIRVFDFRVSRVLWGRLTGLLGGLKCRGDCAYTVTTAGQSTQVFPLNWSGLIHAPAPRAALCTGEVPPSWAQFCIDVMRKGGGGWDEVKARMNEGSTKDQRRMSEG